jgi:hypothetical protein
LGSTRAHSEAFSNWRNNLLRGLVRTRYLFALYWVVTPIPILSISATQLVYRPFPKQTVIINWEDVESVAGTFWKRPRFRAPAAKTFRLHIAFKPYISDPSGGRKIQTLDINLGVISKSSDELLQIIHAYYAVKWLVK